MVIEKELERLVTEFEKTLPQPSEDEQIKYELRNYECFYTGDLEDAFNALPYDKKRIIKVYNEEKKFALASL